MGKILLGEDFLKKKREQKPKTIFSGCQLTVSALAKITLLSFRFLWLKGTSPLQDSCLKVVSLTWNSVPSEASLSLIDKLTDRKVSLKTSWKLLPCSSRSSVLALPLRGTPHRTLKDL